MKEGTKRKRSQVEEDDVKLKEFLEVMQPANKAKKWTASVEEDVSMEPPTKVQALEVPEGESDGEYESVPKKTRQKTPPREVIVQEPVIGLPVATETTGEQPIQDAALPDGTDDDWLRSRTNRLLDLIEPEDIPAQNKAIDTVDTIPFETFDDEPPRVANQEQSLSYEDDVEQAEEVEKEDPIIAAIKSNGRLFVRNLPYTATEDDLRAHFAPYGTLEEVSLRYSFRIVCFTSSFHDEYPDRDSLCYKHMMRTWSNILVDASCLLKTDKTCLLLCIQF